MLPFWWWMKQDCICIFLYTLQSSCYNFNAKSPCSLLELAFKLFPWFSIYLDGWRDDGRVFMMVWSEWTSVVGSYSSVWHILHPPAQHHPYLSSPLSLTPALTFTSSFSYKISCFKSQLRYKIHKVIKIWPAYIIFQTNMYVENIILLKFALNFIIIMLYKQLNTILCTKWSLIVWTRMILLFFLNGKVAETRWMLPNNGDDMKIRLFKSTHQSCILKLIPSKDDSESWCDCARWTIG